MRDNRNRNECYVFYSQGAPARVETEGNQQTFKCVMMNAKEKLLNAIPGVQVEMSDSMASEKAS